MSDELLKTPHLRIEDYSGDTTLIPLSFLQVVSDAIRSREAFVKVRTLRGITFLLVPDQISRVYIIDVNAMAIMADAEHDAKAETSLANLGIEASSEDETIYPAFNRRTPGLDW